MLRDYIELTKPRITWLILMSTGIGYYFGLRGGINWWSLFHTALGTGLIASGTAAHGSLTAEAWVLFAILFLWQFPHFYSIAWMYRDDYARAGIRMLPVVKPDGRRTAAEIIIYGMALIPVSLVPTMLGMSGRIY